jgi:CHAT domain-containing protein/tetratricopeptide (TPR) repeat protein
MSINGARDVSLRVSPPERGTLVVSLKQRGISVIGWIDRKQSSQSIAERRPAASAIERFGRIVLTEQAAEQQPLTVHISSQDPRNITGRVCAAAYLVHPSDKVRRMAEEAFADAGKAVYARNWKAAFRNYLSAARHFAEIGLEPEATSARHSMAELSYRRLFLEHDSYALITAAISQSKSTDPVDHGMLTALLAQVLMDQPNIDGLNRAMRSRALIARSRELLRGDRFAQRDFARLYTVESFIEYQGNEQQKALRLLTRAAELCSQLGDWACYAQARQNNAAIAEEQKDFPDALNIYEDALRALGLAHAPELSADISDNLGRLQARVGLFGRSEQSRKTAMQIYAQLGDCTGVRRSAASLGLLLTSVGSMGDAAAYLDQAVSSDCPQLLSAISGTSGALTNVTMEAPSSNNTRYDASPSQVSPQARCTQSRDLGVETIDDKVAVFNAFASLSNALLMEDDAPGAARCINQAREYAVSVRSKVRLALITGMIHLHQRQPLPASKSFRDALRAADEGDLPETYLLRGFAHLGLAQSALLAGRPEIARKEALHELRMSSIRVDVGQIVASLQLLAGSYRDSQQIEDAIETLRLAVRLIERVPIGELDGEKRATYLATQHAVFSELTEMLVKQTQDREQLAWDAFEISELGRARSLRYATNQAAYDSAVSETDSALEFRALLERVKQVAESTEEPTDLVRTIAKLESESTTPHERVQAKDVVQNLQRLDSTLIEYTAGSRDMFAFVIDRGRIRVVRVGSVEAIARAATKLNDLLRAPEPVPSHIRTAAEELARLAIWPISSFVTTNRIIFVPDDALHTVPFSVLPWSENSGGQLVVHRAESTLLASALLLARQPERQTQTAGRFTLIGDPVFRSADWKRECLDDGETVAAQPAKSSSRSVSDWAESLRRLPGTRTEVMAIANLVQQSRPASNVRTLTRCAATASALRDAADGSGALLHIATHGRIDSHRPRLSALALTPDNATKGDAAFSLLDILNLRLHSRLVVLSACDTSRGRLLPGEGVLGLAQAFLQAGAASVVASFWRVEDNATADFMKKFYDHLISDRLTASAALRRAQLDQASTDGTYSWAAFSLYGSPDTVL